MTHAELIGHFNAKYLETHDDNKYTPSYKKDNGILSRLLKIHTPEQIKEKMDIFFDHPNAWIRKQGVGHNWGTFWTVFNSITEEDKYRVD